MNQERVRQVLDRTNLAIRPQAITKVLQFLQEHIGQISQDQQYQIYSALAIVLQTNQNQKDFTDKPAMSGLTIETVLRHMGSLSKQIFLDVLTRQSQKWRESSSRLKTKIDKVKISYRIYKKYRSLFDNLTKHHLQIKQEYASHLMGLFWILFLYVKNEKIIFENAIEQTNLLHSIFILAFSQILDIPRATVSNQFKGIYRQCEDLHQQLYTQNRLFLINKMEQIHNYRYNDPFELKRIENDQNYVWRYMDDISNLFQKFKLNLTRQYIDQISFLELQKTMTPLTVKKQPCDGPSISQRINFQEEEDDNSHDKDDESRKDMEPQDSSVPSSSASLANAINPPNFQKTIVFKQQMSPFQMIPINRDMSTSPLSQRYQNLRWVNHIVCNETDKTQNDIKQTFEKYTRQSFEIFEGELKEKIQRSIEQFTPSCLDIPKRKISILSFFYYFVRCIYEKHTEEQRLAIFNSKDYYLSILCISTNIINYAFQSLQTPYSQYCAIFNVSILNGFKPINWFGLNTDMPENVKNYLYNLQKRILIQQIWMGSEGFDLLNNKQEHNIYYTQVMLKRLKRHTDERAEDLCTKLKINEKQVGKVINLMRFILQHKCILLKGHNIDQVVVCSIASILSINESRHKYSLQEVFNIYNQMNFSVNSNKNILFDNEGNQIDLIDFYNQIFMPQIDQILSQEQNSSKILLTPVVLNRRRNKQLGIESTPFHVKFPQPHMAGSKKTKLEEGANYRRTLVNSLKSLTIKEGDAQDQCPSPVFGGNAKNAILGLSSNSPKLTRTFSFGDKF